MISNELLSEVYNFEVKDFVQLGTDDVTYEVRFNGLKNGTNYNIINIYELAHKCKEWALSKGYNIWSDCLGSTQIQDDNFETIYSVSSTHKEVNRVILACEWILNNKPL